MRLKITTILALVGLLQIHGCIAHGTAPGEVTQDKEGMQTMRLESWSDRWHMI
jgi:hypothetical protein